MSLADWQKHGWVRPHKTSASEIANQLALADRDLADSAKELSPDWQFNIAYNAALQLANAALAAAGYQAEKGGQHHFRTLQSLVETVALPKKDAEVLEAYRKKRNIAEYDRIGVVSSADVKAMRDLARDLREKVRSWIAKTHPDLLKNTS